MTTTTIMTDTMFQNTFQIMVEGSLLEGKKIAGPAIDLFESNKQKKVVLIRGLDKHVNNSIIELLKESSSPNLTIEAEDIDIIWEPEKNMATITRIYHTSKKIDSQELMEAVPRLMKCDCAFRRTKKILSIQVLEEDIPRPVSIKQEYELSLNGKESDSKSVCWTVYTKWNIIEEDGKKYKILCRPFFYTSANDRRDRKKEKPMFEFSLESAKKYSGYVGSEYKVDKRNIETKPVFESPIETISKEAK